jgi:hypothetical protein
MNPSLRFSRFSAFSMRGIAAAVAVLVLGASSAMGQLLNGRFVTSATTWEKFDTVGVSHKVFRAFQSVLLDFGQGNVSLHTNMQAATSIGDQLPEDSDYRLYNLYVKVRDIGGVVDASLGRMPYFYGVGIGTVDGAAVSAKSKGVKFTLYGGATPDADYGIHEYGTLKDKFAVGGQLVVNSVKDLFASASYVNRRTPRPSYYAVRADQTLDASTVLIVPDPDKEQIGGVDLSYNYKAATGYVRYDYDFIGSKTQRAQVGARYSVNDNLLITVDAARREPRVPTGTIFSQFTLKGVTEVEGGADYFVRPGLRAFVRGAYVAYDGDNSMRYSLGIGRNDVQLVVRGNTGYAGELTSVALQGAYPLLENKVVPNAGISYMSYKVDKQADRQTAFSAVAGATLRPAQAVSLDLQGQWLNNYLVKSDFRFVGRLQFWFSERLNFF